MALENLFSPVKIGKLEIENRIAMAPMNPNFLHPELKWGGEEIRYFLDRVRGGVGLVFVPFAPATPRLAVSFRGRGLMGLHEDSLIPAHARLVDAVHSEGAKIFSQIATFGGKFGEAGPSAIESPNYASKPRELSSGEIWSIIEDFGLAARRAREAGYDGVDMHGCHGYLIGQFMSPAMNRRTDQFGGSFEGRMKFPVEIFQAMKASTGEDFPIGMKFSAWEDIPGGIQHEEAARIAHRMAEEGVCYIHVGTTNTTIERASPFPSVPSLYVKRNTLVPLAENVKSAVKDTPIMVSGSIVEPEEADRLIGEGKCDMVALGRTLLADSHWPKKAAEGKRIRPCIRCNVCHHQLWLEEPLVCSVNPYLLREAQEPIQPTREKKKVMVVGAGPAGISAALAASARGHDVALYEREPTIGGMLVPGTRPECKEDVRPLVAYYEEELASSKVKVKLGVEVTPELVEKESPDALVIAIGGKPKKPEIPGIDGSNVVTAIEALRDVNRVKGRKVVVIGGGDVGCETACYLAEQGKEVTIVEILAELLTDQAINNVKMLMFPLLEERGIKWHTSTTPTLIHEAGLEVTGVRGGRTIPADTVVVATGLEPETVSAELLRLGCEEVHLVGDCAKPGRIRDAVRDGDAVGRLI